jgi:hypothetical protein
MPATTFNIDVYGIGSGLTLAAKACWTSGAGVSRIYTGPTDYTACAGKDYRFVLLNGVWYRCVGHSAEAVGAGGDIWDDTGWHAGAGPGTNYVITTVSTITTAFTGEFYYGNFQTLGSIKNISIEHNSPLDVMGVPYGGDTTTLIFDTEGVITKIKVSGQFFETTAATMDANITALQSMLTGSQCVGLPYVFWWDIQLVDGRPKPYYVAMENFTFTRSEKDTACTNYSLSLVRRAL